MTIHVIFLPQGVATGKYHAAILSNNGDWEDSAVQAGITSGDLLFPIPFSPELHFSEFASAIADMKNSVSVRPKKIYKKKIIMVIFF